MSDITNESSNIEATDRFLSVCIEQMQIVPKTSDKLFTQTTFNNAIKEFVVSEAKYTRRCIEELKATD